MVKSSTWSWAALAISLAFIWKDIVMRVILRKRVKENIVTWSLDSLSIPEESTLRKEEVSTELKEILKTYGVFGDSIAEQMFTEDTPVPVFLNF